MVTDNNNGNGHEDHEQPVFGNMFAAYVFKPCFSLFSNFGFENSFQVYVQTCLPKLLSQLGHDPFLVPLSAWDDFEN